MYADIYFAYDIIYDYIENPFPIINGQNNKKKIFNIGRYLANMLNKDKVR